MQRLMTPAFAVMNRLKYAQKFMLVGLLLVLPLGLVMYGYILQINKDIDFAAKEQLGLQFNDPLVHLYHDIELHETYMNAKMDGSTAFKDRLASTETEIDSLIKAVDSVDLSLGQPLGTSKSWQALKAQWQALLQQMSMGDMMMMTAQQSADAHLAIIDSILTLITDVGNNSNLILDPDIDTYYLMDLDISQLPTSASYLSQIRNTGLNTLLGKGVAADNTRLEILSGLARSTTDTALKDFGYIFGYNPAVKAKLESQGQAYQAAVNQFLDLVSQRVINPNTATQSKISSDEFLAVANQTVDSSFSLYDLTSPALNDLIQARINRLTGQKMLVIVTALVALALSIYLVIAFYLVVMRTIARLDAASHQMVTGTAAEMVSLENKDELGQIALSFNNIARALISTSTTLRTIVDNAADGIVTFDRHGVVGTFNSAAERIFGFTAEEVVGRPMTQLLEPAYAEEVSAAIAVDDMTVLNALHDIEGRRKDGSLFPAEISMSESLLEGRRVFTAIMRDITERRQTEEALQTAYKNLAQRSRELEIANVMAKESNRLKSQFLSTMSHELRTPLNAMVGFTDLLLTAKPGPLTEKQKLFLERIADNNRRLLGLINAILDLSRIEAGRMEIVPAPYTPQTMLERAAALSSSLFSQKNLVFKTSFDDSLPATVIGDRDRVEQIIVNLLSNAAKFTSQGEVELVASRVGDDAWSVTVSDTGPGIAPHMQEIIFEPFRQADGTTTRQFGGSGLGLTISRELCQMMDGTLRLQSELGQGSTFIVTLPIGNVETNHVVSQPVSTIG